MEHNLNNIKGINITVDLAQGAKGFVVIDSTYANSSVGGLRIAEDISLEEVWILAREMTLKYSFIGLQRGGAKAGLKIPKGCTAEQKQNLLFQFGQCMSPLIRKGVFYPWMDINCNQLDLKSVYKGAGLISSPSTESSYYTAISTHASLEACRDFLGFPERPMRLAIEGFGGVANWLIKRLPTDKYIVTAISTIKGALKNEHGFDPQELAEKKRLFGDDLVAHMEGDVVQPHEVLTTDVDILLPSARVWTISEKIATNVRAGFVVPIANAPYGQGALKIMEQKNIVCLPGFVVNSGGVFGSTLHDDGVPAPKIEDVTMISFKAIVKALLVAWRDSAAPSSLLAEQIALERLRQRADPYGNKSPYLWSAHSLIHNYLVPKPISWRGSLNRFTANLAEIEQLVSQKGLDWANLERV